MAHALDAKHAPHTTDAVVGGEAGRLVDHHKAEGHSHLISSVQFVTAAARIVCKG
jgi:hypothetical protein